jgi:hypothetical protein
MVPTTSPAELGGATLQILLMCLSLVAYFIFRTRHQRARKNISKMNDNQYTDEQDELAIYRQAITRMCPRNHGDDHQSESGECIDTYINHDKYKNPQDNDDVYDKAGWTDFSKTPSGTKI